MSYQNQCSVRVQKTRRQDENEEKFLGSELNKIYSAADISFNRIIDARMQKRGIDLLMWVPKYDSYIFVDEKSATSHLCKELKTFAFEISAKSNVNGSGWLFGDTKKTTAYALVYPRADVDNVFATNSVEIIFVSRKAVLNYLNSVGIDSPQKAKSMLNGGVVLRNPDGSIYKKYVDCGNVRIVESSWLREQPVNVLIQRNELRQMAFLILKGEKNNGIWSVSKRGIDFDDNN